MQRTSLKPIINDPRLSALYDEIFVQTASWTNQQIRDDAMIDMGNSVLSLMRCGIKVRILEERGDDMSDVNMNLVGYVRRVAYGMMLAEVVVKFHGVNHLVSRIGSLPEKDQRRLAEGGTVPLVVFKPDGTTDFTNADPSGFDVILARQVFADSRHPSGPHIRNEKEQVIYLQTLANKKRRAAPPEPTKHFEFDPLLGEGKIIGKRGDRVTLAEFVEAVKALQP